MANFTVTNLFDAGVGSLRQAILDANALPDADTIGFNSSLSGSTIQLTGAELSISNSLTINGLGANALTIRGTGDPSNPYTYSSRVFNILGGDVQLSGLKITGGNPYGNGGGILNSNGILTITNSLISDNVARLGGGIHTKPNSTTTIIDSLISNNSAASGGGVYANGRTTITNSTITGNRAMSPIISEYGYYTGFGGGVFGGYGGATITNSIISNNSARNGGGTSSFYGGFTRLVNSNVSNNSGAGVYSEDGVSSLVNSNVFGNSGGGVVSFARSSVGVLNSSIFDNTGSGLSVGYESGATLTNSTISGNTGNGVSIGGGSGANLINSTISGNTNNGVTVTGYSKANITNSTIANNGKTGLVSDYSICYYNPDNCHNLTNTIITNSGSGVDCSASLIVNVNNLIADGSCNPLLSGDPNLGPLQNNGGPTQTHALLPGSIAIDAGSNGGIPPRITTDQRGFPRIIGPNIDIGSYEAAPEPQPEPVSVPEPEPLALLGVATATMFVSAFKRKLAQRRKRKRRDHQSQSLKGTPLD